MSDFSFLYIKPHYYEYVHQLFYIDLKNSVVCRRWTAELYIGVVKKNIYKREAIVLQIHVDYVCTE